MVTTRLAMNMAASWAARLSFQIDTDRSDVKTGSSSSAEWTKGSTPVTHSCAEDARNGLLWR
jgi:hypothetical protein